MRKTQKNITLAALFAALAFAVAALCSFFPLPLVPALPFLHYDAKDVVIVLCGFILGPVYALAVSLVSALLELTISSTGPLGAVMNFLASAIFACTASLIYKYKKNIYGALMGLLAASAMTTAFMLGWNLLISPYYMGITREVIKPMLLPFFLPFNLIKTLINSGVALLTYKPVISALRAAKLVETKSAPLNAKSVAISVSAGILLIALCIASVLFLKFN